MFEKLKERLLAREQKNAHKSICTWIDKEGISHTEEVIMKRSRLPLVGDWGRIYPVINENGNINWINVVFGGKKNFIKLLLILGIIALFFFGVYDILHQSKILMENPCVLNCINKITIP